MRRLGTVLFIVLFMILCNQCLTVRADYADADKAYDTGDYASAFKEFMTLAESGDVRAQVNIGWMYYYGEGVPQDKTRAIAWYQKAADQGDVTSMFNLAYEYEHGDGVRRSLSESGKWYVKAARQNNVLDRLILERLSKQLVISIAGKSPLFKVLAEQKRMLSAQRAKDARIAAAAEIAKTAHVPAVATQERRKGDIPAAQIQKIVPQKPADSANMPISAAPAPREATAAGTVKKNTDGNVLTFENQDGEKFRNPRLENLRRAAVAGDKNAQVALGWIYSSGQGVPLDKAKAVKWYRLAAEKGNLKAQVALGWIYYDGQDYKRSLDESTLWYGKAAAQGDKTASEMLKKIKRFCAESEQALTAKAGCPTSIAIK